METKPIANIHAKLQKIQSKAAEILKDNTNKFQNYKYFTEYQALTFLKPLLEKEKLTLTLADLPELGHSVEKMEKNWAIKYWKQAILTNSEQPSEQLEFKFWAMAEGQDLAKTKGAAETYSIKYFLTKFFLIPLTNQEDPDKEQWTSTSKPELNEAEKELSAEQKKQVAEFFDKHKKT